MKITSAEFIKSATAPSHFPPPSFPEIAFAGRSNVGKSTLINALTNRKKLAATSSTPGKTRLINFFILNRKLYLVDLPGYGFARVSLEVRKEWGPMVETYLKNRPNLRLVIVLLDSRRTPSEGDLQLIKWLKATGNDYVTVVTKADKLSRNELQKQASVIRKTLGAEGRELIFFSAKTGDGKDALWREIQKRIGEDPREPLASS
jgi:GTP-binding protein